MMFKMICGLISITMLGYVSASDHEMWDSILKDCHMKCNLPRLVVTDAYKEYTDWISFSCDSLKTVEAVYTRPGFKTCKEASEKVKLFEEFVRRHINTLHLEVRKPGIFGCKRLTEIELLINILKKIMREVTVNKKAKVEGFINFHEEDRVLFMGNADLEFLRKTWCKELKALLQNAEGLHVAYDQTQKYTQPGDLWFEKQRQGYEAFKKRYNVEETERKGNDRALKYTLSYKERKERDRAERSRVSELRLWKERNSMMPIIQDQEFERARIKNANISYNKQMKRKDNWRLQLPKDSKRILSVSAHERNTAANRLGNRTRGLSFIKRGGYAKNFSEPGSKSHNPGYSPDNKRINQGRIPPKKMPKCARTKPKQILSVSPNERKAVAHRLGNRTRSLSFTKKSGYAKNFSGSGSKDDMVKSLKDHCSPAKNWVKQCRISPKKMPSKTPPKIPRKVSSAPRKVSQSNIPYTPPQYTRQRANCVVKRPTHIIQPSGGKKSHSGSLSGRSRRQSISSKK